MLSVATIVTVTVAGEAKGLQTGADLLAAVVQQCGDIPLTVLASDIDAGNTVYNAVTFQWFHYSYVAHVTVSVPGDTYDDVAGVASDVAGVFEDVAGSTPTGVQSSQVGNAPVLGAPAGSGIVDSIGSAIGGDLTAVFLILAGLIVLIVVAIGWGKNSPVHVFV